MPARRPLCLLAASLLLLSSTVGAHHAVDLSESVTVTWTGTITETAWDGAHVMYRIEVINETDQLPEYWELLAASPKILRSRGISPSTIKPGERVQLTGYLDRARKMLAPKYVIKADGQRYDIGFYPAKMSK